MTTKTEGQHAGEFLLSEANGTLSRETGTLATRAAAYKDGTVISEVGGKLVATAPAEDTEGAIDTDAVVGVLYGNYDASAGDVPAVYVARLAEVKDDALTYPDETSEGDEKATVQAALDALLIRTR